MDLPYQVINPAGIVVLQAPESCRHPRRIELDLLEYGYTIRLHGKEITRPRQQAAEKGGGRNG